MLARRERAFRDFEFAVELKQTEVPGRDVAHDGCHPCLSICFGYAQLRARGSRFRSPAAKNVQLESQQVEKDAADAARLAALARNVQRGLRVAIGRDVGAGFKLRKLVGTNDAEIPALGVDASYRGAQVVIALHRAVDEILQRLVFENLKPLQIADRLTGRWSVWIDAAKLIRRLDHRRLILSLCALCHCGDELTTEAQRHKEKHKPFHLSLLAPALPKEHRCRDVCARAASCPVRQGRKKRE